MCVGVSDDKALYIARSSLWVKITFSQTLQTLVEHLGVCVCGCVCVYE